MGASSRPELIAEGRSHDQAAAFADRQADQPASLQSWPWHQLSRLSSPLGSPWPSSIGDRLQRSLATRTARPSVPVVPSGEPKPPTALTVPPRIMPIRTPMMHLLDFAETDLRRGALDLDNARDDLLAVSVRNDRSMAGSHEILPFGRGTTKESES